MSDIPVSHATVIAQIRANVAHIARGCRSELGHDSVAYESYIDRGLDMLGAEIDRKHDLELALARLYDATQSENFSRPARAPDMTRKLRAALDGARKVLDPERPQPRAEAETALTTAEDGTPHSPVPHVGAAATAENVAPKRPPSEPEPKPAADTTAAGSITGSAPAGGVRNEKKLPCGCYVAYGQGNTRGVWSISAVAFLCDKGHKQADITEIVSG